MLIVFVHWERQRKRSATHELFSRQAANDCRHEKHPVHSCKETRFQDYSSPQWVRCANWVTPSFIPHPEQGARERRGRRSFRWQSNAWWVHREQRTCQEQTHHHSLHRKNQEWLDPKWFWWKASFSCGRWNSSSRWISHIMPPWISHEENITRRRFLVLISRIMEFNTNWRFPRGESKNRFFFFFFAFVKSWLLK